MSVRPQLALASERSKIWVQGIILKQFENQPLFI